MAERTFVERYGPVIVLLTVGVLEVGSAILIYRGLPTWSERGTFGDMFGAVNSLFSGLALAGVIYAIILQRQELALQRQELELTRDELQRAATAQETSAEINRLTLEELREQRHASISKEKRPFRASIILLIRTLESFRDRELTPVYEQRDTGKWPNERQLTPPAFEGIIGRLLEVDPDLHGDLNRLNSVILYQARLKLNQMQHLASQGRATIRPEIEMLEGEFRGILQKAIDQAHAALVRLEEAEW